MLLQKLKKIRSVLISVNWAWAIYHSLNGLFGLYSSIMLNLLLHYTTVTVVLPFYLLSYLVNNKTDPQKAEHKFISKLGN